MDDKDKNTTQKKPGRPPRFNEPTNDKLVRLPMSVIELIESTGRPVATVVQEIVLSHYGYKSNA